MGYINYSYVKYIYIRYEHWKMFNQLDCMIREVWSSQSVQCGLLWYNHCPVHRGTWIFVLSAQESHLLTQLVEKWSKRHKLDPKFRGQVCFISHTDIDLPIRDSQHPLQLNSCTCRMSLSEKRRPATGECGERDIVGGVDRSTCNIWSY
jgi:hypothetical protein